MGELLHLVQRGGAWASCGSAQSPPRCTKCNSPPINDQCTNVVSFDVAMARRYAYVKIEYVAYVRILRKIEYTYDTFPMLT